MHAYGCWLGNGQRAVKQRLLAPHLPFLEPYLRLVDQHFCSTPPKLEKQVDRYGKQAGHGKNFSAHLSSSSLHALTYMIYNCIFLMEGEIKSNQPELHIVKKLLRYFIKLSLHTAPLSSLHKTPTINPPLPVFRPTYIYEIYVYMIFLQCILLYKFMIYIYARDIQYIYVHFTYIFRDGKYKAEKAMNRF